jgi:hypothetical protein
MVELRGIELDEVVSSLTDDEVIPLLVSRRS